MQEAVYVEVAEPEFRCDSSSSSVQVRTSRRVDEIKRKVRWFLSPPGHNAAAPPSFHRGLCFTANGPG